MNGGGVNSPGSGVVVQFRDDDEIAVIRSGGVEYKDWETVMVQIRWHADTDICRFSTAERREDDGVVAWQKWQLKPCDTIEIILAGKLAMTGTLIERQVAYDPENHGIQLLGKGTSIWGYKSSVNTKEGSFDDMSFLDIARKVLDGYGNIKTIGDVNPLKFEKVQNNPGENNWTFLENLAKVRGIIMASDKDGSFLFIGNRVADTIATLEEGVNIKSLNFTVNVDDQFVIYQARGQQHGGDSVSITQSNEQESIPVGGTGCHKSILIQVAEQPVTKGELDDRAKHLAQWQEGAKVYVTAVVQGWTYNGVDLWETGAGVWVRSPMCPIDQKMCIQRATFQQSRQAGTTTTLDLVMPWMLNDSTIPLGQNVQAAPGAQATPDQIQQMAPN